MILKDDEGNGAHRFVPTEVAAIWADRGTMASDGLDLYQWQATHWQRLADLDAQAAAMNELLEVFAEDAAQGVAAAPWLATVTNAKHSVAAAKLYLLDKMPMGDRTWHDTIPVQNGYLDFASRDLLGASKDDWLQHVLSCDFEPMADADRYAEYLDLALPDVAVRERVQEHIGSCLLARSFGRHQLWMGPSSQIMARILRQLFGNAAVTTDALESFRLSALVAESEGYSAEKRTGIANVVKDSLGARTSKVNARYVTPATIHVAGKWIVIGELIPTITDPSAAYWRRWDAVTFLDAPDCTDYVIECELPGVLNWALEGLTRLVERGEFGQRPDGVMPIITRAKNDESSIVAWADARNVRVTPKGQSLKAAVYESYRGWCEQNDLRPIAVSQFWVKARNNVFGQALESFKKVQGGRELRMCNLQLGG